MGTRAFTAAPVSFTAQPSVNKPLVLELMKGEYLDKRENLILVGASGTGETHLATALGMAACLAGKKVRFFRVTELITTLIEARDEKLLLRLRSQLAKQHLLILDELGYQAAVTHRTAQPTTSRATSATLSQISGIAPAGIGLSPDRPRTWHS